MASQTNGSGALTEVPLYINGKNVTTAKTFEITHPGTGKVVSKVSVAGESETADAIKAARKAFFVWNGKPALERARVLMKAAEILESKAAEFNAAYTGETSVSGMILGGDFAFALEQFRSAARIATEIKGEIPHTSDGTLALVLREPYGVVFGIAPFNFGLTLSIRSFAAALACGNTVIMKASPQIAHLHSLLGPLLTEAGAPEGVLQILQFAPGGEAERMEQVIGHKDVRLVNFTGSTKIGTIIGVLCAKYLKPVLLELGGKAPAIVLESADLKLAANNIVFGALMHSGQTCMCTERVIVLESVADKLIEELRIISEGDLKQMGSMDLASEVGVGKMKRLVDDAVQKGAKALTLDHTSTSSQSLSYPPTVFVDVPPTASLYYEESFGPALIVIRAKTVDEAVEIANDSDVGLSSSVWTGDLREGLAVARRIEAGAVHINGNTMHDDPSALPHGGVKGSGFGRFNGMHAGLSFTQTKSITMPNPTMLPLHILK